jgi:dolichyl-phosphate-mannose-protein mannosyltransferase
MAIPTPNSTHKKKKKAETPPNEAVQPLTPPAESSPSTKSPPAKQSEWDFRLALVVITIAAFATRFWGISHPNQVVFDEVHFGKVF